MLERYRHAKIGKPSMEAEANPACKLSISKPNSGVVTPHGILVLKHDRDRSGAGSSLAQTLFLFLLNRRRIENARQPLGHTVTFNDLWLPPPFLRKFINSSAFLTCFFGPFL
jgi:hypothetical protein